MYALLYDSTIAWYKRRRVDSRYVQAYAITTLTSMGWVNVASAVILAAYFGLPKARELLFALKSSIWYSVIFVVLLVVAHTWYSRRRALTSETRGSGKTSLANPWISPAYGAISVALFIYLIRNVASGIT
jgi:hypothetical protein